MDWPDAELIEKTSFLQGRLFIFQPRRGFRFAIDAVILANFVELKRGERALEVGAGPGVVSFILALKFPFAKIFTMERERLYLECLRMGMEENALKDRIIPIMGDFRAPCFLPNSLEVVFSNPPYFEKGRGRQSPDVLRERACRDESLGLNELLKGAKAVLKSKGRLYLIFTAHRSAELIKLLYQEGLTPKVLRFIHSYPGDIARFVLVRAQKSAGEEVRVLPPLFIYKDRMGEYTEEVKNWLQAQRL